MKKRIKRTVVVKTEIDYEKLAVAIIEAQNKVTEKASSSRKFREAGMSFFNGSVYAFLYGLIGYLVYALWNNVHVETSMAFYKEVFLSIILAFIGIYAFLCQQESLRDTGTEIHKHFNNIVPFAALILTLVTLFRGV